MELQRIFDVLTERAYLVDCPGAQDWRVQQAMRESELLEGDMIMSVPNWRHRVVIIPAPGVTISQIEERLLTEIERQVGLGHINVRADGRIICP